MASVSVPSLAHRQHLFKDRARHLTTQWRTYTKMNPLTKCEMALVITLNIKKIGVLEFTFISVCRPNMQQYLCPFGNSLTVQLSSLVWRTDKSLCRCIPTHSFFNKSWDQFRLLLNFRENVWILGHRIS